MTETLTDQLHALDREIDAIRRRIWMVQHGLIDVDDPERELPRLDSEYRRLGDRYVETYRKWSRADDEG